MPDEVRPGKTRCSQCNSQYQRYDAHNAEWHCVNCGPENVCPDCKHPAHPIPLFRTSNDCAVGCSQCSLASWSNEALERLLDDILAERAAAK